MQHDKTVDITCIEKYVLSNDTVKTRVRLLRKMLCLHIKNSDDVTIAIGTSKDVRLET